MLLTAFSSVTIKFLLLQENTASTFFALLLTKVYSSPPTGPDLVAVLETVSGEPARVFALATQDITPYGNDLHHLNSILQPAVATDAPVVGVAITTVTAVAGCATGASHEVDIALAARFAVEVAKGYGAGVVGFHDEAEFAALRTRYGSATHLQTLGTTVAVGDRP